MRVHVEGAALGRFAGLEDNAQDAANGFIQDRLVQFAGADGFDDGLDAAVLRAGHFQIQPALQCSHPVAHGAPVRDDQPLEAPFIFQDIGQQVVMLGAKCR